MSELDEFWYRKLHDSLPSGVMRAIGRFAYGILKEMVKLSLKGYKEFPPFGKGYVFEKVMSIIRRTRIENEVLMEILNYMGKEDLEKVESKIKEMVSSSVQYST